MSISNSQQASSAYWRGNKDHESLQRVYGISFPDQKRQKVRGMKFVRDVRRQLSQIMQKIAKGWNSIIDEPFRNTLS
ncbi:threonine--tRNA ligase, mitochondrial 1-like [Diospyros lotus]|uniref:threonine--tRNA ligase, mitochondrial 1-like n=1 Tax=Diospyros lotus TaxID=55363 RepID=UPI0022554BC8|nr:threonine--tRNA ligase, mitochondrial 1-like [Diospyros lotus]